MGKEGTSKDGLSLRKSSISHANSSTSYGLASPTSTRPGNRRRDTSDSYPFPGTSHVSPVTSRFSRDESTAATPPPALLRRKTDFKESDVPFDEKEKEKAADSNIPFGGLKRSTTGGLTTSTNTSASPWSNTQGSSFSPMGSFGSFAMGSGTGSTSVTGDKRPALGGMRSGSRFKDLMSKDFSDEKRDEQASLPNLGVIADQDQQGLFANENRPTSKDTDPFQEDELRGGSAALGGGLDMSPPRSRAFPGFGGLRQESREDSAFGAFGMTSDTVPFPGIATHRDLSHQTPQQRTEPMLEPMSPTDTNPFQSPENDKSEPDDLEQEGVDIQHAPLPGLGGFGVDHGLPGLGGFGNFGRGSGSLEAAASDRSQTSSAGARGIPGFGSTLSGLPGLGGPSPWSAAPGSIGTPTRDRSGVGGPFGESLFSSTGDGLAGLGSSSLLGATGGPASIGTGTIGRSGGRLGAGFPPTIQDQFRGGDSGPQSIDDGLIEGMDRQQGLLGTIGRGTFGPSAIGPSAAARDESPFRSGRGVFDDGFGAASRGPDPSSSMGLPIASSFCLNQTSISMQQPIPATAPQQPFPGQRGAQSQPPQQASSVTSPSSSQPPVAQVRQMVMPDRMKWVYKDPEGNTQGPFSGLEMHDWYKAGFFTPELLIKKVEDPEYEPLAQLIRRIGNSREPFLVPQIGIPHEPPVNQRNWTGTVTGPAPGGGQAPFPNNFPSFGTTLTAEQQNALERRKQEEQYLMARQKEHLAQQQILMRQQMQMQLHGPAPNAPSSLHHHSSAHSLHSQPSFGSITSPGGYQASPTQGPVLGGPPAPGFFEGSFPAGPAGLRNTGPDALPDIREEELPGFMERLNQARQAQGQTAGSTLMQQHASDSAHAQQVQQMMVDRARLQGEQDAQQPPTNLEHERMFERLQQFQELRAQDELESNIELTQLDVLPPPLSQQSQPILESVQTDLQQSIEASMVAKHVDQPSLTEQVQKAQSAKDKAQKTVWNQVDPATMLPIARQDTNSPMPAPIAQRKSNVAETLAAESCSPSQTPSAETLSASLAPWAKETIEAPKGPSLKEIQDMEAKKAAQQEELAAAARKAAFEKELAQAAAASATQPTPGLPSTSTWANSQSPSGPTSTTSSVWAKANVGKPGAALPSSTKKTLAQIQKEEEARKQKLAIASQTVQSPGSNAPPGLSSGKTYAGLAGKNVPVAVPTTGGAWTTVGAGGKVKTPTVPIPSGPARAVSGDTVSMAAATAAGAPAKPKGPQRSTTLGSQSASKTNALDEFKKWAANELKPHLNRDINNGTYQLIGG